MMGERDLKDVYARMIMEDAMRGIEGKGVGLEKALEEMLRRVEGVRDAGVKKRIESKREVLASARIQLAEEIESSIRISTESIQQLIPLFTHPSTQPSRITLPLLATTTKITLHNLTTLTDAYNLSSQDHEDLTLLHRDLLDKHALIEEEMKVYSRTGVLPIIHSLAAVQSSIDLVQIFIAQST